jgi:hypothetical protein
MRVYKGETMSHTTQQTIEDFYAASETRNKPGTGVPRWSWEDPKGSLYSVTAHQEAIEDDRQWAAEKARVEAARVSLEDQILEALQSGDREEARRLMRKHRHVACDPTDRYCCS